MLRVTLYVIGTVVAVGTLELLGLTLRAIAIDAVDLGDE